MKTIMCSGELEKLKEEEEVLVKTSDKEKRERRIVVGARIEKDSY